MTTAAITDRLLERGALWSENAGTIWAPCPWCGTDLELSYDPRNDRGWCCQCWTRLVPGDMAAEVSRIPYRGPARRRGLDHVVGVLLARDVPVRLVAELAIAWGATRCTPAMDGAEALAVVEWVAARELDHRGGEDAVRD